MADDAPPGSGSGNVLQPDSPGRALVRLALTGLTVAAALYFSIKTLCIDWPDACSHAAQYVPGWVFALEPVARQFAPYIDFIGAGFRKGWQTARPELELVWSEAKPGLVAAAGAVDAVLSGWKPWQVAAASSLASLGAAFLLRRLFMWLHEVNRVGILAYGLRALKRLPFVQGFVDRELGKVAMEIWEGVKGKGIPQDDMPLVAIPAQGIAHQDLLDWIDRKAATSVSTSDGKSKVSGAVYFPDQAKDHAAAMLHAYEAFTASNPLHPDTFPSVRRMEAEVVTMTASILGGGRGGGKNKHVCGLMTSGGTESILSAVKASRDFVMELRGVKHPEMVVASSAHPAYFKAASYFGIRLIKVPVDPKTLRLTAAAVQKALTAETVLVVASAPSYPHGVVDEVAGIARAAARARVLCHVDACLGGFVLPFARMLGHSIPDFDFTVPGVTSMSVDTHKFGLAHKGTSVVLFAGPRLRTKLYTAVTEWSGGPYISPGMPGSRSGGLIATAWASLAAMGIEGFLEVTSHIMKVTKVFKEGLGKLEGLEVMGEPEMSVVAFRSSKSSLNIYKLNDLLSARGWSLAAMHLPPALHMCFTAAHTPETARQLVQDISECARELQDGGVPGKGGSAKLYGMSSSLPDRKLVGDILEIYQDIQLSIY